MKVFAHRGFSSRYPENTLLAFKKSLDFDIYGVELDVHKTKDNKIVVIHDESVDRTFDGSGFVKDLTLNELKSFNCRLDGFKDNPECKIPTLEEVIEIFLDSNFVLNIEIKNDKVSYENIEQDVINIINKYNISDRVILSSFNSNSILHCNNIDSCIKTGLLYYYNLDQVVNFVKSLNASSLHPPLHLLDKELVDLCHKENMYINVYTVDDVKDIYKNIELGVDGIFTNYPDIACNVLKNILTFYEN